MTSRSQVKKQLVGIGKNFMEDRMNQFMNVTEMGEAFDF